MTHSVCTISIAWGMVVLIQQMRRFMANYLLLLLVGGSDRWYSHCRLLPARATTSIYYYYCPSYCRPPILSRGLSSLSSSLATSSLVIVSDCPDARQTKDLDAKKGGKRVAIIKASTTQRQRAAQQRSPPPPQ